MKTTYLVYKQIDGVQQLVRATQEEWNVILKKNKGLPMEQRRLFTKDCFMDGDELDCMYIEMSAAEYREWNSKNTVHQRNRKEGARHTHLSMDAGVADAEHDSLHDLVPSDFNLERIATDRVLMDELTEALKAWKPWAEELLKIYLSGAKRSCTAALREKYRLSDRAIRKRKEAFEKFVLNFLKE